MDLVILNERGASYVQDLQVAIEAAVRISQARPRIAGADTRGKVFVLRTDLITAETRALLLAVARVVLSAGAAVSPTRWSACSRCPPSRRGSAARAGSRRGRHAIRTTRTRLEFFNGIGGFAAQGREYVITAPEARHTPVPWINVVANRGFGFQVANDGGGYTWSRNSRENALTPWANDPVVNRPGEAIYLRDEETGELWSPRPRPIRHEDAHILVRARHGLQPLRASSRTASRSS